MGGNLATDCGRNNIKFLTPFSTALGMRDRNGHEKSHRRKPMAVIRLVCPYRCIVSLKIDMLISLWKGKFFGAFYRRFFIFKHYLTLPKHRGQPLPLADLDVINVRHS